MRERQRRARRDVCRLAAREISARARTCFFGSSPRANQWDAATACSLCVGARFRFTPKRRRESARVFRGHVPKTRVDPIRLGGHDSFSTGAHRQSRVSISSRATRGRYKHDGGRCEIARDRAKTGSNQIVGPSSETRESTRFPPTTALLGVACAGSAPLRRSRAHSAHRVLQQRALIRLPSHRQKSPRAVGACPNWDDPRVPVVRWRTDARVSELV